MKQLVYLLAALCITNATIAQSTSRTLKKTIELKMALTAEDDMPGTRGAAVVWHPIQKKYYAAMAGNIGYPLSVFDVTGKRISPDTHITDADVRGLWYNPIVKAIQGNEYSSNGWFQYKLNAKGFINELQRLNDSLNQPDAQSTGVYNVLAKKVMFLHEGEVFFYDSKTAKEEENTLRILWGQRKGKAPIDYTTEDLIEIYNSAMVYTGVKGQELGFLNIETMQIELYDSKTGYLTNELKLPEDARVETMFNFSYANGMYWLFDIENRKWTGYK